MKPSYAMRLGAMTTKQAFGVTSDEAISWQESKETCALGAAFLAMNCPVVAVPGYDQARGGLVSHGVVIPTDWLTALDSHQTCPECLQVSPMARIIAHLNDGHRWTRERIADFVEQIEQQAVTTEPALAAV